MNAVFEQFHITVERDGDEFFLRQIDHSGNTDSVLLHSSQIRHLAEVAGLLPARAAPTLFAMPEADDGDEMHSMRVEVIEGRIWIEQTRVSDRGGTDAGIEVHPSQAAWLAARLQQATGQGEARELAMLRRRMLTLYRKLIDLTGHFAWDDLLSRSHLANDLFSDMNLAAELADEFVADLLETGNGKGERASERNENPQAIPVTPEVTKRGRPATGEAMSNAERQAKHRAKQKESGPQQAELAGMPK